MTDQTLVDYTAFDAAPRLKPNGECVLTFQTDGGSILIRMDRVVFDGLLERAQQEIATGAPPRQPRRVKKRGVGA